MNGKNEKVLKHRVIALLNREELEFLEKLSMDAMFSTGKKLTNVDMLSAMVTAMEKLNFSSYGIKSKEEFIERILEKCDPAVERRRYPRVDKGLAVAFRKADSVVDYQNNLTLNVSMGGFMMEIPEKESVQIGQMIEVTLVELSLAKNLESQPIKALGRVVWLKEKEDAQSIDVGVKLFYINEKDKDKMKKYMTVE